MKASLSLQELKKFSQIIYQETGIRITSHKLELVQNRLGQRLHQLNLRSFRAYYDFLNTHWAQELPHFIETITTNETYFFRCPWHFAFLTQQIFPQLPESNVDIWSAASSSGEEPYSLAIALLERLPGAESRKMRVFASDIDRKILKKASEGIYSDYALRFVQPAHLKKYFTALNNGKFQVIPKLRQMILLGQHNLQVPFPKGKMDIVFCRNVLIYFDEQSKIQVFQNLLDALKMGGYLFLGESEIIPNLPAIKRVKASVAIKVN